MSQGNSYNRPTDITRLNTQQLVGLDKHQQMINSALRWQQHTSQGESKPLSTLNRRLSHAFATIVNVLAR